MNIKENLGELTEKLSEMYSDRFSISSGTLKRYACAGLGVLGGLSLMVKDAQADAESITYNDGMTSIQQDILRYLHPFADPSTWAPWLFQYLGVDVSACVAVGYYTEDQSGVPNPEECLDGVLLANYALVAFMWLDEEGPTPEQESVLQALGMPYIHLDVSQFSTIGEFEDAAGDFWYGVGDPPVDPLVLRPEIIAAADGIELFARDIAPIYPNPVAYDQIHLRLLIPQKTGLSIGVYDCEGREVANLFNNPYAEGLIELMWDGRDKNNHQLTSGRYAVIARTPEGIDKKTVTFIR